MSKTRNNHYVPQWYQRGFLSLKRNSLYYLDLTPDVKQLDNGVIKKLKDQYERTTSKCFCRKDLYTTFFGEYINDEVETMLFGKVDDSGARAFRAFIGADPIECHKHFQDLFLYIDSQKLRTPKGLDWIRCQYPELDQVQLMLEMQALRSMHCTTWAEGVREIVTASSSPTKFILSDHPVTVYNSALPPESSECRYPNDPSITLKGSQTIIPLDQENCLILTNYELAKDRLGSNPLQVRTNARNFGHSVVRTDALIRGRELSEDEVRKINLIIKSRAMRYVAASDPDFLVPERFIRCDWASMQQVLLPPENQLFLFGGEMYVGYKDGTTYYQDAFGRTESQNLYLKKETRAGKYGRNEPCPCGSGRKFKRCCLARTDGNHGNTDELSIRERNIVLYRGIADILGLDQGKTWQDVRRELSDEHVRRIHGLYGSLWPIHSDLNDLLPKPDKSTRALYTGILDPRIIHETLISLPLYFEEILVQSPFLNPRAVKADFSPTKIPGQFKQETLKNVLFFLQLYPFIESGYVNLFPDPSVFNQHLRAQAWGMAEARLKGEKMTKEQREQLEFVARDDIKRMLNLAPREMQKNTIKEHNPDLSDDKLNELLDYISEMSQEDPLTLLHDDAYRGEDGQITTYNLSPNLELSLYMAQATGSIVVTDNRYRWDELVAAQHREGGVVTQLAPDLVAAIKSHSIPACSDPGISCHLRYAGRMSGIRRFMAGFCSAISSSDPLVVQQKSEQLVRELASASARASAEMNAPKDRNGKLIQGAKDHFHNIELDVLAPVGGLRSLSVQRLLVSSGSTVHMPFVPCAIRVSRH